MIGLALSPQEKILAVTKPNGVDLISFDDGSLIGSLPVKAQGVYSVRFSPDGKWLAAAAADKRVRVWEMKNVAHA